MKRDLICLIGVLVAFLTGIGRGIGGLMLLKESSVERILGIGLIIVAFWLIVSSICLIIRQDRQRKKLVTIGIILFWLDGILNGFILFGLPQVSGQIVNLIIVAVVSGCLWLRRKAA